MGSDHVPRRERQQDTSNKTAPIRDVPASGTAAGTTNPIQSNRE